MTVYIIHHSHFFLISIVTFTVSIYNASDSYTDVWKTPVRFPRITCSDAQKLSE